MGIVNFGDINKAIAAGAFNYALISAASGISVSVQVKTGEGFLHTVFFPGNGGVYSLFDNIDGETSIPIARCSIPNGGVTATAILDVGFSNGLVATVDGTGTGTATRNATVSYV